MRKYIARKVYDTETAEPVGEYSPDGYSRSDFHYYTETLYLKKTGEYFLYGEGNGLSKYAHKCGLHCSEWGEKIIPLNYEDARQWAEDHLEAREYEANFDPDPEEDDSKTLVYARIGVQEKVILDRLRAGGKTISEIFCDLLREKDIK